MFCGSASLRRRPASLATLLVAPTFRPPFVCLALEIPEAVDTRDKSGGSVLRRHAGTAGSAWLSPLARRSRPEPWRLAARAPAAPHPSGLSPRQVRGTPV